MTEPRWLRTPGVLQFLNHLVDKFDAAEAQGKALVRAIRLDAKSFPGLFNASLEEEREQQWTCLRQMEAWGWFELKLDRQPPGKAPYECNPRAVIRNENAIRQFTGRPERIRPYSELWREAVEAFMEGDDSLKETVGRMRIEIPGRTAEEVMRRLLLLPSFVEEPLLLREVSARLFWGLSKVLDGRQPLVAAILREEECPFPEVPVQLQVFLPTLGFSEVLFIENQATFEQATRDATGRYENLALVFASGFKGSAKRLRSAAGASVYFAAHGSLQETDTSKFLGWLRAGVRLPSWFWGDLDFAGMRILASLRAVFDGLEAWQSGYGPMLERLERGDGHSPLEARKGGQQPIDLTGCSLADTHLIPALKKRNKFVDQEAL
ncbi:hypothetical protein P3T32_004238 [Ralstonia sp. GP73]|nr:hypothetical protein [Ralstonia sp. GP73]